MNRKAKTIIVIASAMIAILGTGFVSYLYARRSLSPSVNDKSVKIETSYTKPDNIIFSLGHTFVYEENNEQVPSVTFLLGGQKEDFSSSGQCSLNLNVNLELVGGISDYIKVDSFEVIELFSTDITNDFSSLDDPEYLYSGVVEEKEDSTYDISITSNHDFIRGFSFTFSFLTDKRPTDNSSMDKFIEASKDSKISIITKII